MKKLFYFIAIMFLLSSCKKDNTALDSRQVIKFDNGVIGYVSKATNCNNIELTKDGTSIFIKEVITFENKDLKRVQYFSPDNKLYHSFKVDSKNNVSDLIVVASLPQLSNTMQRDAIIEPTPLDRYSTCMKRMLKECSTSVVCSGMFSLTSAAFSLGWSLKCLF